MSNRDIVAIGASAGGLTALRRLAAALPANLPASLLVTIHVAEYSPSRIEHVLAGAGPLPADFAVDGEGVKRGRIYVAPPDSHLLLDGERLRLGVGPRENGFRPAIDPRSCVASTMSGRTVAVILSGMLGDGASGLAALQRHGGLAVIQDPNDAEYPDMPLNALRHVAVDYACPVAALGPLIEDLVSRPAGASLPPTDELRLEVEIAARGRASPTPVGRPANLVCPECHGALGQIDEGNGMRFRCHSGHAYSEDALAYFMTDDVARALAGALRALQERAMFFSRMADTWREAQNHQLVKRYTDRADEITGQARVIQELLVRQVRKAA